MIVPTTPRQWEPSYRPRLPQRHAGYLKMGRSALIYQQSMRRGAPVLVPTAASSPLVSPTPSVPPRYATKELVDALKILFTLRNLPENWDGEDSIPPTARAIDRAESWLGELFTWHTCDQARWLAPHISDSADGGVMFEWWNRGRKLTVYFWDDRAEYVQVWGANMRDQMAEGSADRFGDFMPVWLWLTR